MSKCWLGTEKSATSQMRELIRRMTSLTVPLLIVFRVSGSIGDKEPQGGKTGDDKSHTSREECWLREAIRGSGDGMSKPQRWISVEVDQLTVDHGGGRRKVVGVCPAPATFLFTRLHASASCQPRAENTGIYSDVSCVLDAGPSGYLTRLPYMYCQRYRPIVNQL